ncbi:hypothetical protein OPV09_17405 [Janthinobacterium sp. TB1-E2]|uniref:Uncharacterized protein n=1 Tax=Janthinobacterium aestuarii TaxID=2985511 RepID=A0ABZ2GFV9_9BURK
MMAALQLFNDNGTKNWDSRTVAGGIIADVRQYASTETAVLTYPIFAGRSVEIVPLLLWVEAGTMGVVADTALGYPRVTVSVASTTRRFAVEVY